MFKLKVYLPSLQKFVFVKELDYKTYRNLVKSLYADDEIKTIEQFNLILDNIAPNIIQENATLLDKLAVFLLVREVCVSPDLIFNCTCGTTGTSFQHRVNLTDVRKAIENLPTKICINYKEVEIELNSFIKVSEEIVFKTSPNKIEEIAARLNKLKINNNPVNVASYTLSEKIAVINRLPHDYLQSVFDQLYKFYLDLESKDILHIRSPFTNETVYRISGSFEKKDLNEFLKLLFTEDLNNVYRAFYNMVTHCKFTPEYIDNISPAEIQVYWSYWIEENSKKKESTSSPNQNHALMPTTQNSDFGFAN